MISEKRYVSFFFFFEISFRYIETDRLLDAEVRGIQDLRVSKLHVCVGSVVGYITEVYLTACYSFHTVIVCKYNLSKKLRWPGMQQLHVEFKVYYTLELYRPSSSLQHNESCLSSSSGGIYQCL